MQRRVSIALFLLALFWVAEPAYALWQNAAEHACCLPKPKAAVPSCHGMEHDDGGAGAGIAAQHRHSGCAHDCCTKLRTAGRSGFAFATHGEFVADREESVIAIETRAAHIDPHASSSSGRAPPTLS